MRHYRENFAPRDFGLDSPRAILAVNVTVGDTDADGYRLANSPKGFYARLSRAGRAAGSVLAPTPEEAATELTETQRSEPTWIEDGRWPRFVAGGPRSVRATLERMIEESGADELMFQNLIADPADRRHSHELLAAEFGLPPR